MLKITARMKRGNPIISVFVDPEETMDAVLDIISDELTKNEARRVLLDKWIEGGRTISIERRV